MSLFPIALTPDASWVWKSILRVSKAGPFGGTRYLTRPQNRFSTVSVTGTFTAAWVEAGIGIKVLNDFWESIGGGNGVFTFLDPTDSDLGGMAWTDLFVGVGNGVQTIWNLPMLSSGAPSAYVIKVSGVTKTYTTDYSIAAAGGTDGVDKLTMVAAPAPGAILLASATGQRAGQFRFDGDELSLTSDVGYKQASVTLIQVR